MSGWFRMYDEVLDDPKVQMLPAEDFKAWVNLLCLARRHDGFLPDISDIAFALRMDVIGARSLVDRLAIAGLIDTHKGGPNGARIAPHSWDKRQYKSDSSTERVKRYRQRSKPVSETPPEAETEAEYSEDKSSGAVVPHPAMDFCKAVFDGGVALLVSSGKTEKEARALVGKWRKDLDDATILTLLRQSEADGHSDPVAWLTAAVATRAGKRAPEDRASYVSDGGHIYRCHDPADVMREAERRADWATYYQAKADMEKRRAKA